jgi:hypothetical protein
VLKGGEFLESKETQEVMINVIGARWVLLLLISVVGSWICYSMGDPCSILVKGRLFNVIQLKLESI